MAPSKLRKAIGAVKDKASIGLAKVNSSDSLSDIDVTIVKATRHEEYPPEDRHIREIMSLTCYSRSNVIACVVTISKRLSKTRNWVVALKTLMLIHRLITSGDQSYEEEIFFSTRRGMRLLNMSDFRDTSTSNSWHYSAFVRTHALYLDEYLELRMQNRRGKHSIYTFEEEEEQVGVNAIVPKAIPLHEMEIEQILSRAQHLIRLLERFLACRPTGVAKTNRLVIVALCPIVKESFQIHEDITKILCVLIERFMELDVPDSVKVHEIFSRASKQQEELINFYGWCKKIGIARPSEYPDVENIPQKKLDTMDEYIREKSRMAKNRKVNTPEPQHVHAPHEPKKTEPEEDRKSIKELSPQKRFLKQTSESNTKPEEDTKLIKASSLPIGFPEQTCKDKPQEENKTQENADLLNLGENALTTADQMDKLALVLFDGDLATPAPKTSTNSSWVAFNDSRDWEISSVQPASHLSNHHSAPPGHFNQLTLDLMYQQGATQHTLGPCGLVTTGSASSVAFRDAGRPGLQALPAPPGAGRQAAGADPFAASLSVAPPLYVQKSGLEKQQKLLMQEQVMWQQYARDGMQGEAGLTRAEQHYPCNTGGYTRTY